METTGDNDSSVCVVCNKEEAWWSCQRKGCNRKYHLHCVKKCQPDDFITVGVWRCVECIKEKLLFGAAFACHEVESIWDSRHGDSETKYLVKYKNLAHVHNCWIPESKIRQESPKLVDKFIQEYQKHNGITWKKEWTMPERLLLQRNLMHVDMAQKFFQGPGSQLQCSNTEWLVKWKGLGYEHATWEVGSLKLLQSHEAKRLKQEYKNRQVDAVRRANFFSEHNKIKKEPFVRLEAFDSGFPHGLDDGYLDSLNQLRQFWHKSQNALLIDQEESVIRIILFIKSIVHHIPLPFLILSTMKSLSLWEDKIKQLMPSVNTVVLTNKFTSFLVEVTEFWGQDGHLLFQVLLSNPDAIEGFEAIQQISWEGVIVDQCDNANMSIHLEKIRTLSADIKILILNTQLKDDPSPYLKLLSVLEPAESSHAPDIYILKEKISRFIVYQKTEAGYSNCATVPSAGEKEMALLTVLDNIDSRQYLSPDANPRKRKKPDHIVTHFDSHDMMIKMRRTFVEKPMSTDILESSYEELADVPMSGSISVAKIKNQTIDKKEFSQIVVSKYGIRRVHFLLKPRLFRLNEMLGIPENMSSLDSIFLNHVLKSHKAVRPPFIVPKSYIPGPLEGVLRCRNFLLNGLCEKFLQWFEVAKRIYTPYLHRLGDHNPLIMTQNSHQGQVRPQESWSLDHEIDSVCAKRESKLCALQKRELLDLDMYAEREWKFYWIAFESLVKNMHTIAAADKSNRLLENAIHNFKAYQEHMICQRMKLEALQEKVRASENFRKAKWVKMAKTGEQEKSFDFNEIPLPDSGFVFEKFNWFCDERTTNSVVSSSHGNFLKELYNGQPSEGDLSSVQAGALNDMRIPPRVEPDVVLAPVGTQSDMHPTNAHLDEESNSAIRNYTMQQEMDVYPPIYTGADAMTHKVRISQQLSTNITAERTPINPEELPDCADMLLEPVEIESNTVFVNSQAFMPDIGISALRPDGISEPSNDFCEIPCFTQEMFPNGLNLDPLVNELTRVDYWIKDLSKKHSDKKLMIRSQWEGEVQSIKRKYDGLNEAEDATFRKHKKFLQGLTSKVEGDQIVDGELRAFEMTTESDIPMQDWNQPSSSQQTPHQSACWSVPAFMNGTSSMLSPFMPPHQHNPDTLGVSPSTSQASSLQNTRPPIRSTTPVSPVEVRHIRANPPICVIPSRPTSTNQVPPVMASMSRPLSSRVVHTMPPIQPTHLHDNRPLSVMRYPTPSVSTNWSPPVQNASLLRPAPLSQPASNSTYTNQAPPVMASMSHPLSSRVVQTMPPIQPTHLHDNRPLSVMRYPTPSVSANWSPPVQNAPLLRPAPMSQPASNSTYTNQVPPVMAGMSRPLSSRAVQTMPPIQPRHLHDNRPLSVMRYPTPSVSTNWSPPVQNAPLLHHAPLSQPASNSSYVLLSPPPHLRHYWTRTVTSRPQAP